METCLRLPADEIDEREDPRLIVVCVAAADGDDEVVQSHCLGVRRELHAHSAVHSPPLAVFWHRRSTQRISYQRVLPSRHSTGLHDHRDRGIA